jgi:uncharacterized repeat protein (TIGR01451 family)/LPXTG-motif cell wall-anchored protein
VRPDLVAILMIRGDLELMLTLFPGRARPESGFARLRGRTRRQRLVAMIAVALVGGGFATVPLAAVAVAGPSQNCSTATPGTGTYASSLCWLDLSGYNAGQATSTAGQSMKLGLPGGYSLAFTLNVSGSAAHPVAYPTYSGSFLGNNGNYTGVTGEPALYQSSAGSTTAALNNIAVTDANGNAVTGFGLVGADAETTDSGESITWTASSPLASLANIGNDCAGGFTGANTTTVTCTGGSGGGTKTGTVIVSAESPTSLTQTMVGSGLQGISLGVVVSNIQLTTAFSGRISTGDNLQGTIAGASGSILGSGSTGSTSLSGATGPTTVLAGASGENYVLSESTISGDLSNYTQSWSCTRNGTTDPTLPTGAGGTTATLNVAVGDAVDCTVTNTPKPVSIALVKHAQASIDVNSDGLTDAGDLIPYTFTVTNTGQLPVTAVTISDSKVGEVDCPPGALAPSASEDCTAASDYAITLAEQSAGAVDNTATATATVQDTTTSVTSPASTNSTPTTVPNPEFTVSKAVSVPSAIPGGVVTYTITVTNTGNVPYQASAPAAFSDDVSGVLDDATYNNDATNGAVLTDATLSWSGPLAVGASTTIVYSFTVNSPDSGDRTLLNSVAPAPGIGGSCVPGECATTTGIRSFTVQTSTPATVVHSGDVIPYTITITNSGNVDYTPTMPATISANLSDVLRGSAYNGNASDGASVNGTTLNWSGPLAVGASTVITYSVTAGSAPHVLSSSVTPDAASGGVCTTAPACLTAVNVQSFALATTASASTLVPGQKITYSVTVTNTGSADYTTADPAAFVDNLAGVLDDATYGNDASGGASVSGDALNWSGALASGASETITFSATVNPNDAGNHVLSTTVESLPNSGGNCTVSNTDPSCATSTPVAAYSVVKTANAASFDPGSIISYTITVTNTGAVAYTAASPASFTDDLSSVLDDATYNNDATAGTTYAAPTLSWADALPVGSSRAITYSVTVDTPDTGDHQLTNTVVTPAGTGGNCVSGSGNSFCSSLVSGPVLSVTNTASTEAVAPNGVVTLTITVKNTGGANFTAADPASITEDLSAILDDAHLNGDVSNGATVSGNTLAWSGALAAGASETITYSVTANSPDAGDHHLQATVLVPNTITSNCATSSGDQNCTAVSAVESYTIAKSVSRATAKLGDVITYSVTLTNTGQSAFTAAQPASFSDDLSQVLNSATLQAGATPGTSLNGTSVSWVGPLAVGASTVVTYSVLVTDPAGGTQILSGSATPNSAAGGTCLAIGDCSTTTALMGYTIVKTVSPTGVAHPGQTLTYSIVLTNTGKAPYTSSDPATFSDDLTNVLRYATYGDDATGGAVVSGSSLSWIGPLAVGGTVTVRYTVTINATAPAGTMHNAVLTPTSSGANCGVASTEPFCSTATIVAPSTATASGSSSTASFSASTLTSGAGSSSKLADTGSDVSPWFLVLGILLFAGGLLMIIARRINWKRRRV